MARQNFTEAQVRNFRREYEEDVTLTVSGLARKYGTSQPTMSCLLKGISYPNVPGAVTIRMNNGGGREPWMDPEKREEVLRLAAEGKSTNRISIETGISTSQVHYLRNNLYDYRKTA